MSEKLYKIVSGVGAGSIALGIITLVTGVSTGILMIVNCLLYSSPSQRD